MKNTFTVDKQTTQDNTEFYEKYEDIFDGLGSVSEVLYHIEVD